MRLELNRRKFLKLAGVAALTASASVLTACGGSGNGSAGSSSGSSSSDTNNKSDNITDAPDPETPTEASSPAETDGIIWLYRKTSEISATLLGYSTSGKIPTGDVVLPRVINKLEITKIHTSAFKGQTWTSVEIPETVQVIRESAFLGCTNLKKIVLHNGLELIRKGAFSNTGIVSITVPATVTSLESGVFSQCPKLSRVEFLGNTKCGTALFSDLTSLTAVILPDSFTAIPDKMFSNCTALAQINFPHDLKTIGQNAFIGCTSLTLSVVLPDGLKQLGNQAFSKSNITEVTIPKSISSIPEKAFCECKNLSALNLNKGLGSIEDSAFLGCSSLTTLDIPDGVTILKSSCFSNCGLQNVKLPDSLSVLGDCSFMECRKLSKVHMPKTMQTIGRRAFDCCPLTAVIIPDGITQIGEYCFRQDSSSKGIVQTIYFPKSLLEIQRSSFEDALNSSIGEVYYAGTEVQWKSLVVDVYNDCIVSCGHIHYNASRRDAEGYSFF